MTIIRRIINWFRKLFRKLFNISNINIVHKNNTSQFNNKKKSKNKATINAIPDTTMPDFMMINTSQKEKLLYTIALMKNVLLESNAKIKEIDEKNLIKYIQESYKITVSNIIDEKYLESITKDLENEEKRDIIDKYQTIIKREKDFKIHVNEIDKIIEKINKSEISIVKENEIEDEAGKIINDKAIDQDTNVKIDYFINNVNDIIDNVDEYFLKDVVREYKKINYVTVSTMIIDRNLEKLKKLQEDYQSHRYNKFYYEREIKKIKHELNQIRNLKNKKEVNEHIEKLRKELYTKSKDKYDLLYNNEVFTNINEECDSLLNKLNAKVIDIKKEEPKVEDNKKKLNLENILKRFQDMELARQLILLSQINNREEYVQDKERFINLLIQEEEKNLNENFNFNRNKKKTELVIMFNDLNMAISDIKKEEYTSIDHINFRMEDLEEAVKVRKNELNTILKTKNTAVDEKKENIVQNNRQYVKKKDLNQK